MQRFEHGGDVYGNTDICLDFSVNTNPLGMPPQVKTAIVEHIDDYERYPDPLCRTLTTAIARRDGVDASQVLCGNGAADLIYRICISVRPERALTLAPTFSEYERAVALAGGVVEYYPLSEHGAFILDDGILDALKPGLDMLFLCNPNNPTGRLIDPGLIVRIADVCKARGILFVVDECFIEFTDGTSAIPLLDEYPNMLILRAFTKIYAMAGLRLGYVLCADKTLLRRVREAAQVWSVSVVAQVAGRAALAVEGWSDRSRQTVRKERTYLEGELTLLGLNVFPSDANFLLVRSETSLYEPLKKQGILVRPCANFAGLDESSIRIGLKTHEQNETLIRVLRGVAHG